MYALNGLDRPRQLDLPRQRAVKGGPAYADGILYFGDYAGPRLRPQRGHRPPDLGREHQRRPLRLRHRATSTRPRRSPSAASTWATPTAASTRSPPRTGQLAWATATGAYVYASPAVADVPGLGPTVYIGSYDGNFYAFNAHSGSVRWRIRPAGKISGSATIVDSVVYYSDLGTKHDGLDVRTGQQVFSLPRRRLQPGVADDKRDLPGRLQRDLPAASARPCTPADARAPRSRTAQDDVASMATPRR